MYFDWEPGSSWYLTNVEKRQPGPDPADFLNFLQISPPQTATAPLRSLNVVFAFS